MNARLRPLATAAQALHEIAGRIILATSCCAGRPGPEPIVRLASSRLRVMKVLGDIESKRLIMWKGFLFLLCGLLAALGLLVQSPTWTSAALLFVALWSFCRWYYFMFYVIEKYVDREYRFAGLGSFFRYMLRRP